MADNVAITAGSGTTIAADDIGGVLHQRVKISQGADGTGVDVSSAAPLQVTLANTAANATAVKVDNSAVTQPVSGTVTANQGGTWTVQPGNTANTTAWKVDGSAVTQPVSGTVSANATLTAETTKVIGVVRTADGAGNLLTSATRGAERALSTQLVDASGNQITSFSGGTQYTEDAAAAADPIGNALMAVRRDTLSTSEVSADGDNIALKATNKGKLHVAAELRFADTVSDVGSGTGGTATQRVIVDSSQLSALGQTTMSASAPVTIASNQAWQTGMSNKAFSAAFTTLTRPANVTAYTAADSISNNATAGSVTALTATISDTNDDPIFISEILVDSTDTGLAGKKIRAYLYNSDPTASSGVVGGDNAAFSNKKAGYIGSFMGWMETGFSDGSTGRLVPTYNETNFTSAGSYIVTKPTSGAKTLFIQYQAVEAFTPSANSTTIIGTARGWQGRAA